MRRINRIIAAVFIAATLVYSAAFGKESETSEEDEEEPPDITLEAPSPSKPSQEGALQTVLNVTKAEDGRKQAEAAEYKATHERRVLIEAARIKRLAQEAEKQRKLDEEANLRRLAAEKAQAVASKSQVAVSRGSDYVGKAQSFTATAYTAYCEGCSGITKTGVNLRQSIYHEGRRVIAVDPRRIPLGSIVRVTLSDGSSFEATAQDIGSAIQGAIIDVAHETKESARIFGRQSVEVRLIRKGR